MDFSCKITMRTRADKSTEDIIGGSILGTESNLRFFSTLAALGVLLRHDLNIICCRIILRLCYKCRFQNCTVLRPIKSASLGKRPGTYQCNKLPGRSYALYWLRTTGCGDHQDPLNLRITGWCLTMLSDSHILSSFLMGTVNTTHVH